TKIRLSAPNLSDDRRPLSGAEGPASLRRRIRLDAREQLFWLAFAARREAGFGRCLAVCGGRARGRCVGLTANLHFGRRSRSLPRRKPDLCGSTEPRRGSSPAAHVSAGVSRLLSRGECPPYPAARPR